MINEITYKEIPHSVYKRGFTLSFPPGRSHDLFFKANEDISHILKKYESVWDYLESVQNGPLPKGIYSIKGLDENCKYILVICSKRDITPEQVKNFLASLFTTPGQT